MSTIQSRLSALLGSAWHVNQVAFVNQLALEIQGGNAAGIDPLTTTISTVGAGTLTAAALTGGIVNRTGSTAAYSDTTDTAVNIIAAMPNQNVGTSQIVHIENTVAFPETISAGAGVTVSGNAVVPPLSTGVFLMTIATAATVTLVGIGSVPLAQLPDAQYVTAAGQSTQLTGAQVAGAKYCVYDNTGTTPGNLQMPIATALVAAIPNAQVGQSYVLRIRNSSASANTATITTATGITLTGTMTIPQFQARDYIVTLTSLTTVTVQSVGITAANV